jgi:thioesterase domain-containing protein/acyl carrier protein
VTGGRIRWFNAYGPTETCTATIYEAGTSQWEGGGVAPIGRPIPNTAAYVLDRDLRPAPVGVPGELFLGGAGVARGYWNAPELTGGRFLADPFGSASGGRIYRTGDLAYFLPDGNLVFVGRTDRQVKIRGYRVELEEIESVLSQHPGVRQCAVTVQGAQGREILVAYVAPKNDMPLSRVDLALHLSRQLPEQMVPAAFVTLPELPVTPSGKLDRRSLPEFDPGKIRRENLDQPSTPTEKRLAELWRNVLGVTQAGTADHFFEWGGTSLRATQLIVLIEKHFGKEISLTALLRNPTIGRLAALLDEWKPAMSQRHRVVAIQSSGNRTPLFFLQGYPGYLRIATRLGPRQPVFCIPNVGAHDVPADCSMEQLVEQYLAVLREFQPSGPYLLGGWCQAGVLAYEMGRKLVIQGQSVPLVALFDSVNPAAAPGAWSWRQWPAKARFHLDALRNLGDEERFHYVADRCRWMATVLGSRLRRASYRAQRSMPLKQPSRLAHMADIQIQSVLAHRPGTYPGRVLLFRCRQTSFSQYLDGTYGWGPLVQGGLEVVDLPGDHRSLFEEPIVSTLARELEARLRSCAADKP